MMEFEQLAHEMVADLPADLELIEVLWRQDVDLGVGKEVFDPNLRRELEHERELEIRKEQEKRKLEEKHKRELQQQNEQWLLKNFIRDGETGELIPIVGGGNSSSNFSSSGPSTVYPESTSQAQILPGSFELDKSFHIDRTYVPQLQQTFGVDLPDSLLPLDSTPDEKQFNYSPDDGIPLQDDWDELFSYLNDTLSDPPVTDLDAPDTSHTSSIGTFASSPEDPVHLMTEAVAPNTIAPQHYYSQQQYHGELLQPNMEEFLPLEQVPGGHLVAQSDLKEPLHQMANESMQQSGVLAELLNQADMLLCNATLPLGGALDTTSPLASTSVLPVSTDQGLLSLAKDLNGTTIAEDDGLTSDEWTREIYPHLLDLANQTSNADLFDSLPVLPNDVITNLDLIEDPSAGSDSAISVGSVSPQQDMFGTVDMSPIQSLTTIDLSPFEGLEGATGGSDFDSTNYAQHRSRSTPSSEDDGYNYSCSSYGSPASVNTNYSTGSNDTEHSSGHSSVSLDFVNHNHTYPTLPGNTPREVKKYIKKDGSRMKGPQSKDAKRAAELKIPYSIEQIIETPVEEFNNMLTKSSFTEAQMNLMRDIRRRGKNKIAAQNCRKRKMDVIVDLSGEKDEMKSLHEQLTAKRHQMELEMKQAREMYSLLYKEIFASLRDEDGCPYDPSEYSLQHGADGNVFLVRLPKQTATTTTVPIAVAPNASHRLGSKSSGGSKSKHVSDLQKKKKE